MSTLFRFLFFSLIILCFAPFVKAQEGIRIDATCVRVLDGDTIDIVTHKKNELFRVRLWGIDAPESSQDYGAEATQFLTYKTLGKTVHVQVRSTDMYGRLIGVVYYGDECINISLLETGYAWYYEKYAPYDIQLSQAQRKAQESKSGLWTEESPLAPWLHRKINREDSSNYAISPLIAAAASGHAEVVEYLIKSGADANGIAGKLALFAAIREGHDEVVSILLASGVDVYTQNDAYNQQCDSTATTPDEFEGKCIRVADGDSIDVCSDDGTPRRVHLHGIDAPELSQKHGLFSQSFLLKSVHGKQLKISPVGKDANGDIVANVYKENEHINHTMVAAGWAWAEESKQKEQTIFALESSKAKTAKLGIWNEKDQPVTAPWQYRKSGKIVNDTGKIAISLATSSGKIKITKQLISHGVRVVGEVGSIALKYAQDAKSAELSKILIEKGAQVFPAHPLANRSSREVAVSEMRTPSASDYKKPVSLIRNNFNELDDSETKQTSDNNNQGRSQSRNQYERGTIHNDNTNIDAKEADLIKAASEGDIQKVKALVESGVDPSATYSKYRIQTKTTQTPNSSNEKNITAQEKSVSQSPSTSITECKDISKGKRASGFQDSQSEHSPDFLENQPKPDFLTTDESKREKTLTPSLNDDNQSRKESSPSYSDSKGFHYEPEIKTSSTKRRRSSGHRSSSGSRSYSNDAAEKIFMFIILGGLGLLIIIVWIVEEDWYKIVIRKQSLFLTKLLYGLGVKEKGSALNYAALYGDSDITKFLISKSAKDEHSYRVAFETALKEKHYEIAKILLRQGTDARGALSEAIRQGNQEIIYFICSIVPSILSDDNYSHNLMSKAIELNNYNSVACLLNFGATVDSSILSLAIKRNCGSLIIKTIINNGVRPTYDDICSSIDNDAIESFIELLDHESNLNSSTKTNLILHAIRYARPSMVKVLFERCSDSNQIEATEQDIIDNLFARWRYVNHKCFVECLALLLDKTKIKQHSYDLIKRLLRLKGTSDAVSLLVSYTKNLDYENSKVQSLLDLSLRNENLKNFDILVDAGVNLEQRNELFQTVLMRACYNSYPNVVISHLLEKGADVNACDNTGMTPFLFACIHFSYNMVMRFIQHGARLDSYDMYKNTALIYTCRRPVNISWPMENDALLIAEDLIKRGADVNAANKEGKTSIHIALHANNIKLVHLLVEKGANINAGDKTGMTPFMYACKHLSPDIVEILIEKNVNIDNSDMYGNTALLYASERFYNNSYQIASLLINRGVNVNIQNHDGKTALHIAIENKNEKLTELLIEKGADINALDKIGNTPILIAAKTGNRKLLRLLLAKGTDIGNSLHNYPHLLVSAIMCKDSQLASLLIKNGANVNSSDLEGKTCLEHAIMQQMPDVCLLLIERGANVLARRRGSTTLLYKAQKNKLEDVANKIREKGGCMYAHQQECHPSTAKRQVFPFNSDSLFGI